MLFLSLIAMTDGSHELKVGRRTDDGGLQGGRYSVYILSKEQVEAWFALLPTELEDLRAPTRAREYPDDIREP